MNPLDLLEAPMRAVLEFFHSQSNGESLRVNIEIIKENSALAAQIAVASQNR